TTDMVLRNSGTGAFQVYDISNNVLIPAPTPPGVTPSVGLNWQFSGIGNFSSNPGESDLLLRDTDPASPTAGQLRLYDIVNNTITPVPGPLTTIGLEWQFAGVAPIRGADASDLVLRNVNTGAFQVYNIANNQLMGSAPLGQVGSEWQLGGFAATFFFPPNVGPPLDSSSQPDAMDGSTAQLVQAMAGFGGGSGTAESLNTVPLSAETSQQPLLTTPQHV
ncbi:MAG TPA: hypothetical protein VKH44_01270, partial [Pirellulaceae bacterium]|nr:hypothetical protein [Pirellulaceae bacterium]